MHCIGKRIRPRSNAQIIASLRQQGLNCARLLIVLPYADDDPAGASVSRTQLVAVLDDDAGGESE
jgi:hypothetical protein